MTRHLGLLLLAALEPRDLVVSPRERSQQLLVAEPARVAEGALLQLGRSERALQPCVRPVATEEGAWSLRAAVATCLVSWVGRWSGVTLESTVSAAASLDASHDCQAVQATLPFAYSRAFSSDADGSGAVAAKAVPTSEAVRVLLMNERTPCA